MADHELKGVGGWLSLLVFILGIISPIRIVLTTGVSLNIPVDVEQSLGPNWAGYEIMCWVLAAIAASGAVYLAYRLKEVHSRSTVALVIKGLWILSFAPPLVDLLLSLVLFPHMSNALLDSTLAAELAKGLIFPTIWSLYLMKSVRVANTYVDDETDARRIFG
jgi:hypothetical protein